MGGNGAGPGPSPASSPDGQKEPGGGCPGLLTWHPGFADLLARLPALAATDLPVLVLGEPGTGKELAARALWALSPRRRHPLSRLNCATLSAELATSELFGHVQGAFTGAAGSRPGRFRLAHQGTLFLDEIGDLPLAVQPRLLRALEQGEIEPLGGDRPLSVDVRILAATNQDLPRLIAQGRFRQDVYDRLAVLVLHLPPLRERGDDALHLARFFLQEEGRRYGRPELKLSAAAERRLLEHHWPGNVRELKNLITRTVVFCQGNTIQAGDLSFTPSQPVRPANLTSVAPPPRRPVREELEELLRETGGNVSALARRLQVCTRTVYRWLRALDLDPTLMRTAGLAMGGVAWGRGTGVANPGPLPPTSSLNPLS